jgi:PKD repeat protein
VAQLTIVVDSLGSDEAITALSEVTLDATASTGSGTLTYRLDFGDGTSAATASARHVYNTPGSDTAVATITDAEGRTTTLSKPVVVRSLIGAWLHAGYSAGSREVLVRRLSVTSQAGTTVRGFVGIPNQPDRPVTGELATPRTLRLAFDDPAFGSLEGVLPKTFGQADSLELRAVGGPANGERLEFRPAEGEPTGPPPDAVLNHRYFSFGAPFAIRGFSPMRFDGSGSRGDSLSYFIEFGDGQVSTEPVAVHPIEEMGTYTARLTVVDRYGQADSETLPISVRSLTRLETPGAEFPEFWIAVSDEENGGGLTFIHQRGSQVSGLSLLTFLSGNLDEPFTGVVSSDENVRLVLERSEVVLTGTLRLTGRVSDWRLELTQLGGAQNGRKWVLHCCKD